MYSAIRFSCELWVFNTCTTAENELLQKMLPGNSYLLLEVVFFINRRKELQASWELKFFLTNYFQSTNG